MPEVDKDTPREDLPLKEGEEHVDETGGKNTAPSDEAFDEWKRSALQPAARTTEVAFLDFDDVMPPTGGNDGGEDNAQEPGDKPDAPKAGADEGGEKKGELKAAPDLTKVQDFSIGKASFDELGTEEQEALTKSGVERLSVITTKAGAKAVLVELDKAKTLPMDESSGCKSLTIDKKFKLEVGKNADENIVISNIMGIKAALKDGGDVTVTKLEFVKGKDGAELKVTGMQKGEETTTTIKIPDDKVAAVNEAVKQLGSLVSLSETGTFGEIPKDIEKANPDLAINDFENAPEVKAAQAKEKDFTKQLLALLGIAGGALVARKLLKPVFSKGDKPAEEGKAGEVKTGTERLVDLSGINRNLLDGDLLGRFVDKVGDSHADLFKAGAAERLRNLIPDFMAEEGIKDAALSKDRMEVKISKTAETTNVTFVTEGEKSVERRGAEFYHTGTNDKVEASKVKSVITVPETLVAGADSKPLAGALFKACIDASDRGVTSDARTRALAQSVVSSMAKHVNVPEATLLAGFNKTSGLDAAALPVAAGKPVEISLGESGVRIAGVESELTFKDIWKDRVEKLEKQKDELSKEADKNKDLIAELDKEIAHEKALLDSLNDPKSSGYDKAVVEAKDRLKDLAINDREVERIAEKAKTGDRTRGRLVAVTIIAGFLLSQTYSCNKNKK